MPFALGQGQPVAGYALGLEAPGAPAATAVNGRPPIFAGAGMVGFTRSAAFGLLLGIAVVVYIDGRILPRKRG